MVCMRIVQSKHVQSPHNDKDLIYLTCFISVIATFLICMYRAMWNHFLHGFLHIMPHMLVECMHFCIPLDSHYLPICRQKFYILLPYIRTFTSTV